MELLEALYRRRSVRAYTSKPVDRSIVMMLLRAAVQAPSTENKQPWAFAIVQDAAFLRRYSDRAKAMLLATLEPGSPWTAHRDHLADPDFNIFYDATTLIIVCAKPLGRSAAEDCCLAAENLMLAACGFGLGTCPIGFARPWLSRADVKDELGIPADYDPVFPVVVGHPREEPAPVMRHEPAIIFWK